MIFQEDLEGYASSPDEIKKFLAQCVIVPSLCGKLWQMSDWCQSRWGDRYPHMIMIDILYKGPPATHNYKWTGSLNELAIQQYLFWFAEDQHRVEFALNWC